MEPMYPALSRCFEVAPPHDTRYTLVAEDAKGTHRERVGCVAGEVNADQAVND